MTARAHPMERGNALLLIRAGAAALAASMGVAASGAAWAAGTPQSTVVGLLAADGTITEVSRLGSDTSTPNAADVPVTLHVKRTVSGGTTTITYTVTNITARPEPLTLHLTNGTTKSVTAPVATPYVAQLHAVLPASATDVQAPGAAIISRSDGTHELTWSLVLFEPIGAPISTVTLTSRGTGRATANLDVVAATTGDGGVLDQARDDAHRTGTTDFVLGALASGADAGLVKLADGAGKIVAGLRKLEDGTVKLQAGLKIGADATSKVAGGLRKVDRGSHSLTDGLDVLHAGTGKLADGADKIHDGSAQITVGLDKTAAGAKTLLDGGRKLTAGTALTAAGTRSLSDGLQLISAGLDEYGSSTGLPAIQVGAVALRAGVEQISAGLGAAGRPGTILDGLTRIGGGLTALDDPTTGLPALKAGVDQTAAGARTLHTALDATKAGLDTIQAWTAAAAANGGVFDTLVDLITAAAPVGCVISGTPVASPADACDRLNTAVFTLGHPIGALGASDPGGVKQGSAASAAGLAQISTGLAAISAGLASGSATTPGVAEGLDAISAGLGASLAGVGALGAGVTAITSGLTQIAQGLSSGDQAHPGILEGLDQMVTGLAAAITGMSQLSAGSAAAATGAAQLADGSEKIAAGTHDLTEQGLAPIADGLSQLAAGSGKLTAGTGEYAKGQHDLDAGMGKAASGSGELSHGLHKLSVGQDKIAAGLPKATDGAGQLADGTQQLADGTAQVEGGLREVQTKLTSAIVTKIGGDDQAAKTVLAQLDASMARLTADGPATGTTYLLTQDKEQYQPTNEGGHLLRNAAVIVLAALVITIGIAAGNVTGSRR